MKTNRRSFLGILSALFLPKPKYATGGVIPKDTLAVLELHCCHLDIPKDYVINGNRINFSRPVTFPSAVDITSWESKGPWREKIAVLLDQKSIEFPVYFDPQSK